MLATCAPYLKKKKKEDKPCQFLGFETLEIFLPSQDQKRILLAHAFRTTTGPIVDIPTIVV